MRDRASCSIGDGWYQLDATTVIFYTLFHKLSHSTCFGHLCAHRQECGLCGDAACGVPHCKRELGVSGLCSLAHCVVRLLWLCYGVCVGFRCYVKCVVLGVGVIVGVE